jgi:hypothetical protein
MSHCQNLCMTKKWTRIKSWCFSSAPIQEKLNWLDYFMSEYEGFMKRSKIGYSRVNALANKSVERQYANWTIFMRFRRCYITENEEIVSFSKSIELQYSWALYCSFSNKKSAHSLHDQLLSWRNINYKWIISKCLNIEYEIHWIGNDFFFFLTFCDKRYKF